MHLISDINVENVSTSDEEEPQPKRPRGRPRLYPEGFVKHMKQLRDLAKQEKEALELAKEEHEEKTKKPSKSQEKLSKSMNSSPSEMPKRGPGRPRKVVPDNNLKSECSSTEKYQEVIAEGIGLRECSVSIPRSPEIMKMTAFEKSMKRKEVVETPENKFSLRKKRRIMDVNYDDDLNSRDSDDESDRRKKKVLRTPISTPARSELDTKFLERME